MKVRKEVNFNVLKILRSGDHPNDTFPVSLSTLALS